MKIFYYWYLFTFASPRLILLTGDGLIGDMKDAFGIIAIHPAQPSALFIRVGLLSLFHSFLILLVSEDMIIGNQDCDWSGMFWLFFYPSCRFCRLRECLGGAHLLFNRPTNEKFSSASHTHTLSLPAEAVGQSVSFSVVWIWSQSWELSAQVRTSVLTHQEGATGKKSNILPQPSSP